MLNLMEGLSIKQAVVRECAILKWCRRPDLNRHELRSLPPQDSVSTNSTTSARDGQINDLHFKNQEISRQFWGRPAPVSPIRHPEPVNQGDQKLLLRLPSALQSQPMSDS